MITLKSISEHEGRDNRSRENAPDCLWVKWSEVAQSYPTLYDPMDCSLPGFSVYGIFQARVLEWVVISFSKESSRHRDRTLVSHIASRHFIYHLSHQRSPSLKASVYWILKTLCHFVLITTQDRYYYHPLWEITVMSLDPLALSICIPFDLWLRNFLLNRVHSPAPSLWWHDFFWPVKY